MMAIWLGQEIPFKSIKEGPEWKKAPKEDLRVPTL